MSFADIIGALQRARLPVMSIALVYALSVAVGVAMVDSGNGFAIDYRDDIVHNARNGSILTAYERGDRLSAALQDFGGNLFLGAIPQTIGGLGIVFPYPLAAYRGWIGGIVSIGDDHKSRLDNPSEAGYYILVLALQLIPYSLAGGSGVYLGLSYFRSASNGERNKWLGLPREAVLDVLRIYVHAVPLFFIASMAEFFL